MARLIWTEPALQDVQRIAEYIALDDVVAAQKLVKKIFSALERLETFPKSGRRPLELKNTNYREKIVGPCRIFYRYENDQVYILFVMRSEQQLRHYILEARKKNVTEKE